MYEAFMTAFINDVDFRNAQALLSGYCSNGPHKRIHRVLYYEGVNPNQPTGITNKANIHGLPDEPDIFTLGLPDAEPAPDPNARLVDPCWAELNDVLKKQSHIVTTRYEVSKDRHFGDAAEPVDASYFDAHPGALWWHQMPDPASVAGGQSLVLQRKMIEIPHQLNLHTVLGENHLALKSECVEETHDFYETPGSVEFHLVRHFRLPPPNHDHQPTPTAGAGGGRRQRQPLPTLPAYDDLEKVDPAGKWTLVASAYVMDNQSSPEKIKAARDALAKVQKDLSVIRWRALDRRVFDTSMAPARQPVTQTLGNTQQVGGAVR